MEARKQKRQAQWGLVDGGGKAERAELIDISTPAGEKVYNIVAKAVKQARMVTRADLEPRLVRRRRRLIQPRSAGGFSRPILPLPPPPPPPPPPLPPLLLLLPLLPVLLLLPRHLEPRRALLRPRRSSCCCSSSRRLGSPRTSGSWSTGCCREPSRSGTTSQTPWRYTDGSEVSACLRYLIR